MVHRLRIGLVFVWALAHAAEAHAGETMRKVGPGTYRPLYAAADSRGVPVSAFMLDRSPVTNRDFARFVRVHPEWQKGHVARILGDESYLEAWENPLEPGPSAPPNAPVVHVSWFAAQAYCAARGARLPSEAEWEVAAAASATRPDANDDEAWTERIRDWYSRPMKTPVGEVGRGPANFWGIHDLHGLIWEWVFDFNSTLVTSDSRDNGRADSMRFCGAGALGARDKTDYVRFMRVAFRSSLRGDYTTALLGFRCARSLSNDGGTQ